MVKIDEESGESSSGSGSDEQSYGGGNKRLKLDDKVDRLSALPDSIFHHILSFLPSTKEIIQAGILSKRWLHQWTRVPVFIFDFCPECSNASSDYNVSLCIDSSLMFCDCSRIKKFHLEIECRSGDHNREIRFALLKNVEELLLSFFGNGQEYVLPKFLFNSSSLVHLDTRRCLYASDLKVSFDSLKVLQIHWCKFGDGVIENVLLGSPSLESLELSECYGFKKLLIASETLTSLSLGAELSASLIEIECRKIKKLGLDLDLNSLHAVTFRSKLPSLFSAALEFAYNAGDFDEDSAKKLLEQFPQAQELRIGGEFIKMALKMGGLCPPLNTKSLTLLCYHTQLQEIKYALCNSPLLEKLVLNLRHWRPITTEVLDLDDYGEEYWSTHWNDINCLESHLKIVKVIGLSKQHTNYKLVLKFIGFLLKNARVLEKLVVMISKYKGKGFALKVSREVMSFPRCGKNTVVELSRYQYLGCQGM